MSFFFRPKKLSSSGKGDKVVSPLRSCASNDAWDMYASSEGVESPEDIRPSTIAASIIDKSDASSSFRTEEEEWDAGQHGEYESCDEDYFSDDEEDEAEGEDNLEMSSLSEQDRQRAMGMTIAQLRAILPQEEGTVWRISGQRLEKITTSSSPPIGVFESAEVYLCALPTHSFLQLHLWIGRNAHRDKIGLGCVRAVQMRAALALLSMTGGKEVTIQQRQGQESHAFLLPFGGSIRVVARPYPRRRLLRALPLDLNPDLIVYRVMSKDFSKESLPSVELRRLRPYSVPQQSAIQQLTEVVHNAEDVPVVADRSSKRRGSVQDAIQSRYQALHQEEHEDLNEKLKAEKITVDEQNWQWLEMLLKTNRDNSTCLLILTQKPRRLHDILHGHKQFSADSLKIRVEKCFSQLTSEKEVLSRLLAEESELQTSLASLSHQSEVGAAELSLQAAVESINALSKQDISLIRTMKKPPKSVMLVLEAVTRVLQSSDNHSKKEKSSSLLNYFEAAKKTWLLGNRLEGFDQFLSGSGRSDHAQVIKTIEPFLEHKYFQTYDAARTSKVAGALCMWIRELCTYCHAYLSDMEIQKTRTSLEDRKAIIVEQKDELSASISMREAKFGRLNKRLILAEQLRDSLATQRHTLTIWMGSKQQNGGLGGETVAELKSEENELKSPGSSRPFELSRVASLLMKLGPSVTRESNQRSRQRSAVFAAACGISGSFSLQGTVAASGKMGGHHRLHADDEVSSDENDEDDDEDEDEDVSEAIAHHGDPKMSIIDGGFLAMEIIAKNSEETEGEEEGVEMVCERAEECLLGSVQELHSQSAYIFISPSHNQYHFTDKGAVTDVEVFLWMGAHAPLAARMGARRSVRVLAEWSVDALGAQVDEWLGIGEENVDNLETGDTSDVDDYSMASDVLSPSSLSLPDELTSFPSETSTQEDDLSGNSLSDGIDGVNAEYGELPRMFSETTRSTSSSKSLKKKASVRWKESLEVDSLDMAGKASVKRQGGSMTPSNKAIQAHKLEHSASIANLLNFIETTVLESEGNVGTEVKSPQTSSKSFKLGVAAVREGVNEDDEDDDSDYGDARSLRHSQSLGRISETGPCWDDSVAVCGSRATLRIHFHTISEGNEPFDFRCYFKDSSAYTNLTELRSRKCSDWGAANTPLGLSRTLHKRKVMLVQERRSLWDKFNQATADEKLNQQADSQGLLLSAKSGMTVSMLERLRQDAMNEARRVCLDADIRCNEEEQEVDSGSEQGSEDGQEHVTEFDELVQEIKIKVEESKEVNDEEGEEDGAVMGCVKGIVADSLLAEIGTDEGLEGLLGDDGSGEILAWRLDADGLLSSVLPEDVGMLESHFVYVFFYASMVKESSGEDMQFVVYLWHGLRAPQHQVLEWEINVKPNFVIDFWEPLTSPLRPKPLFVHVAQGKEPAHFRRIFEAGDRPPFIVYSSSLTTKREPYFRLITFRVRELDSGFISITQVPSTVNAFLSSDVLIVIKDVGIDEENEENEEVISEEDSKNELWFWVGCDSNDEARRCAALSVSMMLEYMGLSTALSHMAQVVSEEEVIQQVVNSSRQASKRIGLEEDGTEEDGENEAHKRFHRLLKAITPEGDSMSHTEAWWEVRKREHLARVVQGECDEGGSWEHVSEDRLWSESCPTPRLYAVSSSYKQRRNMPSPLQLEQEKGRKLSDKLRHCLEHTNASKVNTSKFDMHYKLKRVPFFLYSDLICAEYGAFVDSPVGIYAFEPMGMPFEASLFLHQIVSERMEERSVLAASTLGESGKLLSSHGKSAQCPVYWLNKDVKGLAKFKAYFQEYDDLVGRSTESWAGFQAPSKSTLLLGEIKVEDGYMHEWYHELSAYDRTCLRRGSLTISDLSSKRPTRPRQDTLATFTVQSEASTQPHHHHRIRRSSILSTDALEELTAHPMTSIDTGHIGSRRHSMTGRRQSHTAARRFSVQQLLVDPSSPSQMSSRTGRRLSLQNLSEAKSQGPASAESSFKKDRRNSLQPLANPVLDIPTPSPVDTTRTGPSTLARLFGFRTMSSLSSSSFSLGFSPRSGEQEGEINQSDLPSS